MSSDDVFQETGARYRAVEPEQWLQRHPEAGSSWPSWPKVSHREALRACFRVRVRSWSAMIRSGSPNVGLDNSEVCTMVPRDPPPSALMYRGTSLIRNSPPT